MNSFQKISRNKFVRSVKAISPIFATLILIAIAVIAGIVVYMFTSGAISTLTGGGTAGQEKIAIQSVQYATGGVCTLNVQTIAGSPVFTGSLLKDSSGNTVATGTVTGTVVNDGSLYPLTTTLLAPSAGTYTVTLVTKAGGSFPSSSFTVTTP